MRCTISVADGMTWERYNESSEGHERFITAMYYAGMRPGNPGFPEGADAMDAPKFAEN